MTIGNLEPEINERRKRELAQATQPWDIHCGHLPRLKPQSVVRSTQGSREAAWREVIWKLKGGGREMSVNKQEAINETKIIAHNIIPNPSQDNVPIHTQPLVGGKALCPRPTLMASAGIAISELNLPFGHVTPN